MRMNPRITLTLAGALIVAAATGSTDGAPDADTEKIWKRHGAAWFKTERGGRELAGHMFALGAWPVLRPPPAQAVRSSIICSLRLSTVRGGSVFSTWVSASTRASSCTTFVI